MSTWNPDKLKTSYNFPGARNPHAVCTWHHSIAKTQQFHCPSVDSWQNVLLVSTGARDGEVPHHPARHLRGQRSDRGFVSLISCCSEEAVEPPVCIDLLLDNDSHAFYGPDLRGIGRDFLLSLKNGIPAPLKHWSVARAWCALTRSGQNIYPLFVTFTFWHGFVTAWYIVNLRLPGDVNPSPAGGGGKNQPPQDFRKMLLKAPSQWDETSSTLLYINLTCFLKVWTKFIRRYLKKWRFSGVMWCRFR